jgi:hypothetical protein
VHEISDGRAGVDAGNTANGMALILMPCFGWFSETNCAGEVGSSSPSAAPSLPVASPASPGADIGAGWTASSFGSHAYSRVVTPVAPLAFGPGRRSNKPRRGLRSMQACRLFS